MLHRSFIFFLILPVLAAGQTRVQKFLHAIKTAKTDSTKIELYRELVNYYKISNLDSATYFAQQGLVLARKGGYRLAELRMTSLMGAINEQHGNRVLAMNYYREALEGFRETGDLKGMAACTNGLGVIEGRQGNFNIALSHFFKALKMYEKAGDKFGMIQTYIKIGTATRLSGNMPAALKYLNQARDLNMQVGDKETELSLFNNIGIVYAQQGQMAKALRFFEEGVRKSGDKGFEIVNINLLTNAGGAAKNLGDRSRALRYHRISLQKARSSKLPEEEARALMNIASAVDDQGPKVSLPYLDQALIIAKRLGNKTLMAEIYEAQSDGFRHLHDYKSALGAVQERHKLLDSMFNIDKAKEIANLQSAYELDKSKEKVERLELVNNTRTIQRNAGILAAFLIMCFLVLLLLYIRKIRALNTNLKNSNLVKDKLFSIIGHDLRGPIGTVVQMLGTMEETELDPDELKPIVSVLKKQSEASLGTLDTLLQWGKTQLQGVRVNKISFRPDDAIHKNLSIFAATASQKHIDVSVSVPDGLLLYGDPDHFDFIIRNLLSNAIKFTYPYGKIEVKAVNGPQQGSMIFSVSDNGKGMNPAEKDRIFNCFSEPKEGTSGERGTGIGLVLCKEFIQADNGEIWVESREGEGSVFSFSVKSAYDSPFSSPRQTSGVSFT